MRLISQFVRVAVMNTSPETASTGASAVWTAAVRTLSTAAASPAMHGPLSVTAFLMYPVTPALVTAASLVRVNMHAVPISKTLFNQVPVPYVPQTVLTIGTAVIVKTVIIGKTVNVSAMPAACVPESMLVQTSNTQLRQGI